MVLWVFGYGSLIWNPGFDFDDKILGFIKGYKRTFNLGMDACTRLVGNPKFLITSSYINRGFTMVSRL